MARNQLKNPSNQENHLQKKHLKKPSKKLQRSNSLILLLIGLLIFAFGAINYYRVRILSFSKAPPTVTSVAKENIPAEIIIPSINIDLSVDSGVIENGIWKISNDNATYLSTSKAPGEGGNTVIYGHNLKRIFGSLPYVGIGQKISVKTESGKIYNYKVTQKLFVKPDRVDLVSPTDDEELTIYTCYGLFDSQRAVIKATPI